MQINICKHRGELKKKYYNTTVKHYSPMSYGSYCGVGPVEKKAYKKYLDLSLKRVKYDPVSIKQDLYTLGYEVKIYSSQEFESKTVGTSFRKKEQKVLTYKSNVEAETGTRLNHRFSKNLFNRDTRFFKALKNVMRTINGWFKQKS